jgi:hypothetical protein
LDGYTNHIWNGVTASAFGQIIAGIVAGQAFTAGLQHLVPADTVTKHQLVQLIAQRIGRTDLTFRAIEPAHAVNRTLATNNAALNRKLWANAGYSSVPTISQQVQAMAV